MSIASKLIQDADAKIKKHGFTVIGVFGDEESPAFSYTIGLAEKGHPELIIVGLPNEVSFPVLNDVVARLLKGSLALSDGLRDSKVFSGFDALFREAPLSVAQSYVRGAISRLARINGDVTSIRVFQIVWPDPAGRFGGEVGADARYAATQTLKPEVQN